MRGLASLGLGHDAAGLGAALGIELVLFFVAAVGAGNQHIQPLRIAATQKLAGNRLQIGVEVFDFAGGHGGSRTRGAARIKKRPDWGAVMGVSEKSPKLITPVMVAETNHQIQ